MIEGYRYAKPSEIDGSILDFAREALREPLGATVKLIHAPFGSDTPLEYLIRLEAHYHPPGGRMKPWGHHKGATVYVRKQS